MSNQFLKLRRSAVPGKIPDTASLDFGEIALNTYDGLAFMKKSGSNGVEIITIGSTTGNFSGSFTGSLFGTASYASQALSSSYTVSASYSNLAGFANDYTFTSSLLEYYVDRRFTGSCEVTILGDKSINSSNAAYLTQLSASRVGDPNHPWPDPWSANLRASASISSGQSTNARIIVKTGNTYTYGSSVLTQNGDLTGSLTNNLRPDIAVSQSNYNLRAFDLITPNVEYYLEPESSLYNINKSWQQMLVSYSSTNWDIAPEFKIIGQGKFVNVYGQGQGFICKWGTIGSPRAEITLEADHIIQNMWRGWTLIGQKVNVNVDKWWSQSGYLFDDSIGSFTHNWPSQSLVYPSYSIGLPIVNININEIRWGDFQFGGIAPAANDFWGGMNLSSTYGTEYNININKFTFNVLRATDGFFRSFPAIVPAHPTASNSLFNINIGYISGSHRAVGGGLSYFFPSNNSARYENMYYSMNVKKFDAYGVGLGFLFHPGGIANSTFKIHCDDYRNYYFNNHFGNACMRLDFVNPFNPATASFGNTQFIVSGNYRNYYQGEKIITWGVGDTTNTNASAYNTLVLDGFRAYNMATSSASSVINIVNPVFGHFSSGSQIIMKDSILFASGSNNIIWNISSNPVKILADSTHFNKEAFSGSATATVDFEGSYTVAPKLFNVFR